MGPSSGRVLQNMEPSINYKTVLILDDHYKMPNGDNNIYCCKLLKNINYMKPCDLYTPLNIEFVYSDEIDEKIIIIVSSDSDSDVSFSMIAFELRSCKKNIYVKSDPIVRELCIIKSVINIFALNTVFPIDDALRITHRNKKLIEKGALGKTTICEALSSNTRGKVLRITSENIKWHTQNYHDIQRNKEISSSTLIVDIETLENDDYEKYKYAKVLWTSDKSVYISRVIIFENIIMLTLNTTVRKHRIGNYCENVSLTLCIYKDLLTGPLFSNIGLDSFHFKQDVIDILSPEDVYLLPKMAKTINIPKKFHGCYLGIFISSTTEQNVRIASRAWTPNSDLCVMIMSDDHKTIYKGTPLGKLYFIKCKTPTRDLYRCFDDAMKSKLVSDKVSKSMSFLGTCLELDEFVDLFCKRDDGNLIIGTSLL